MEEQEGLQGQRVARVGPGELRVERMEELVAVVHQTEAVAEELLLLLQCSYVEPVVAQLEPMLEVGAVRVPHSRSSNVLLQQVVQAEEVLQQMY